MCSKSGAISYKAQSQDEDALVKAAAQLHMVLIGKNGNIIGRSFPLNILEFSFVSCHKNGCFVVSLTIAVYGFC